MEEEEGMYDIIEEDQIIEEAIDDYGFMDQMQSDEAYEMEEEHLEEEDEKPIILNTSSFLRQQQQQQIVRGSSGGQVIMVQNPSGASYPVKLIASNTGGTVQVLQQPQRVPPQTNVQIVKKTVQQSPVTRVVTQYVQQQAPPKYIVKASGQQVYLATSPTGGTTIKQEPGTSTSITREVIAKTAGGVTISKTRPSVFNSSGRQVQRQLPAPQMTVKQVMRSPTQQQQQPTILNKSLVRPSQQSSYVSTTKVVPKQFYRVTSPGSSGSGGGSTIQAVNVPGKGIQYMRVLNSQSSSPVPSSSPQRIRILPDGRKVITTTQSSSGGGTKYVQTIKQEPVSEKAIRNLQFLNKLFSNSKFKEHHKLFIEEFHLSRATNKRWLLW